ncbi:MAG: exodeoxyribonuclease VII large subunit [Acidobacteria bacterium]|nr:exodeoxyribonuclease VII large subunit [Acidobacteriota bacterium]MBI3657306.1 exodeoxyribonuclease VII large subunit [Acidobacteriota bacterium]
MMPIAERKVFTVAEISREIKNTIETRFREVWVVGEVSNFVVPRSGHHYFTLKDAAAQLKAVCFKPYCSRLRFNLADGLEVIAHGRITTYEPRGDYQMVIDYMEPVGKGALQLAFEQRKEQLRKLGWFDAARKRPLPLLPAKIGIVTSPTGAVIQDILRILLRRNKALHVLIYPAKVQGEGAAEEIAAGIQCLNARSDIDVIIVARGGGSLEDLWAFNEEIVARAIYESRVPLISAVGHEVDFTIADFVADLRAPTPSVAAEMVSAVQSELQTRVEQAGLRLRMNMRSRLERLRGRWLLQINRRGMTELHSRLQLCRQRLDENEYRLTAIMKSRLTAHRHALLNWMHRMTPLDPARETQRRRARVGNLAELLALAIARHLTKARKDLAVQVGVLEALSPLSVLRRGYAICRKITGEVVRRADQVCLKEILHVHLAEGNLRCEVRDILSLEPPDS